MTKSKLKRSKQPDFKQVKHTLNRVEMDRSCKFILKNSRILVIKNYFSLPNTIQEKVNNLYVVETYNLRSCLLIIDYLTEYKLQGQKKVSFQLSYDTVAYCPRIADTTTNTAASHIGWVAEFEHLRIRKNGFSAKK